jgi:hypothetical protein
LRYPWDHVRGKSVRIDLGLELEKADRALALADAAEDDLAEIFRL